RVYDGRDMSPSVSRWPRAALCLLCACPAAAEEQWKPIQAGNQVYYVKQTDFVAFQQERGQKKQQWATAPLFMDLVKDGRRSRVESPAVLACSTAVSRDCRVFVDYKAGGHYDVGPLDIEE